MLGHVGCDSAPCLRTRDKSRPSLVKARWAPRDKAAPEQRPKASLCDVSHFAILPSAPSCKGPPPRERQVDYWGMLITRERMRPAAPLVLI